MSVNHKKHNVIFINLMLDDPEQYPTYQSQCNVSDGIDFLHLCFRHYDVAFIIMDNIIKKNAAAAIHIVHSCYRHLPNFDIFFWNLF